MRATIIIIISVFIIIPLAAQEKFFSISGKVFDENELSIAFASVVIKTLNDSVQYGDLTDEEGRFKITGIARGKYRFAVSFVGYQPYSQEIDVNSAIELPPVQLMEGVELGEVEIRAQRKLITYERGKINLAVENSSLAKLPSATNVLSFMPGVVVNGNAISVIGKGKPLIFINGKEVKQRLQIESLQPEMIKSITLDRNPSAKYDASYNSVIHITTKRTRGENFSAQYIQGIAVNHHLSHSENLNINHVSGKFSNFFSYKFKNSRNTESANTYQRTLLNNGLQTNGYDATLRENTGSHSLTLGSNVKLNDKNIIDLQYFFNSEKQKARVTGIEKMQGITNEAFNVNRNGSSNNDDHTVNISYQRTIDSVSTLQFFGDYSHLKNVSVERVTQEQQTAINGTDNNTLDNRSFFNVYSFRTEYNSKIFSDYNWTLGARYAVIKSNAQSRTNNSNVQSFFNNRTELTETNTAAYTTLSRQFSSVYAEVGLRAEFTGDKYTKNGIPVFDKPRKLGRLFPSALFNYNFSESLKMNLIYSSKIQRPAFYDLDPTFIYLSSVLYSQGNPGLKPMIIHNIEMSGVIRRKLNVSISYKMQENLPVYLIEPSAQNENILLHKPVNLAKSAWLDFSANYTLTTGSLTSNLIGNIAVPFAEYPYMGKMEKNNIPLYQFVAINQYTINQALFLFGNFAFTSKHSSINTVIYPAYQLTLGVNRVLMRGKMILTLFGNDLLHKSAPATVSKYGRVEFGQTPNPDSRMVGISLKYNINGFRNIFHKSNNNQLDMERIVK